MKLSRSLGVAVLACAIPQPAPSATALAGGPQPVVTFRLRSALDGATVAPGQDIICRIRTFASTGDNQGLALALVSLSQDPGNPERFTLPPGRAPAVMEPFDRPLGFTNPDPDDPWGSAYGGTPVDGDLVQIGGAQNTFGIVPPCVGPALGVCQGQSTVVHTGRGQSPGGQLLSAIRFPAPTTPGTYVLRLHDPVATVLESVVPGGASNVVHARTKINRGSISFTVQ